jgi:hypothetical protein
VRAQDAENATLAAEVGRLLTERKDAEDLALELGAEKDALVVEHAAALAAVRAEAESSASSLAAAHRAAVEKAESQHAEALAAAIAEHKAESLAVAAEHAAARAVADREHEAERLAAADRLAAANRQLETAWQKLDEQRAAAEVTSTDLATTREALAERTARATALEQENGALNEQVLRAYHRMKQDETVVARARKALGIALALLDDDGPRSNKPQ